MAYSFKEVWNIFFGPNQSPVAVESGGNVFQIINSYSESFKKQQTPTMLVGGGFSKLQWSLMGAVAVFLSLTIWQFEKDDKTYSMYFGVTTIIIALLFIISIILELIVGFHKEAKEQISRVMYKSQQQLTTDLEIIEKLSKLPNNDIIFAKKTYNRIYFDYKSQYSALTLKGFFGLVTVGSINHFYGLEKEFPFMIAIWPIIIIIFGSILVFSLISSVMSFSLRIKGGQYQRIIDILDQVLADQAKSSTA